MADNPFAKYAQPVANPFAQFVQPQQQGGAQPSVMQTIAASPLGRFAHDAILAPVEGAVNFLHPVDFGAIENPYQDALAAQQNRPGYADARAQANKILPQQGFTSQVTAPLNSTIAGFGGLTTEALDALTGGKPHGFLNSMNATADAQTASQTAYQQAHPYLSTAGQTLGGFMAMPEGGASLPPSVPAAPTLKDLNTAKKAAYDVVDNSTMKISAPEIQNLHSDLQTKLGRMGLNEDTMPNLTPKLNTAMKALKTASADDQTLQAMDIQRRIAGIAAGSPDKTERAAARIVQDGIDDFIGGLQPKQLSGPVDQAAIDALPQARELASRSFKAQQIQDIIDKAKNNSTGFSQSGYENSLRNGFRKLLNNDRGIARFSPAERTAIKQVATGGGSMSATNLLRQIGKLSPQGAVPILAEIGAYGAFGPQALAIPAAGIAGRTGATMLQSSAARQALDLALRGGPQVSAPAALAAPLSVPAITSASRIPYGLLPFLGPAFANNQ